MSLFFGIAGSSLIKTGAAPLASYTLTGSGLNDSYSWWVRPLAFEKDGNLYHGTVQQADGDAHVIKYNTTTQSIEANVMTRSFSGAGSRDEHNAPSILDVGDGILCVSHPRNGTVFSVKKYDYDLNLLNDYGNSIGVDGGFSQANYSQLYKFGSRIFCFCREDLNDWGFTYSDDLGATWQPHQIILSYTGGGEKLYMLGIQNGDFITFGSYLETLYGVQNKFKSIQINAVTGAVTEAGVSKGNIFSGWTSLNFDTDLATLFQPANTGGMRFLDISANNGIMNVVYADFQSDYEDGQYKFKQYDLSDLSVITETNICNHGRDNYITYYGGVYFEQTSNGVWNNKIFLSREEADTWYIEEWELSGGVFNKIGNIASKTATNDYLSLTRPLAVFDSTNIVAIYQDGDYTTDTADTGDVEEGTFGSWDLDLKYVTKN